MDATNIAATSEPGGLVRLFSLPGLGGSSNSNYAASRRTTGAPLTSCGKFTSPRRGT